MAAALRSRTVGLAVAGANETELRLFQRAEVLAVGNGLAGVDAGGGIVRTFDSAPGWRSVRSLPLSTVLLSVCLTRRCVGAGEPQAVVGACPP